MKKNIKLLYGFSFFDQFMIVIALWGPYLTTKGITMRQFMECHPLLHRESGPQHSDSASYTRPRYTAREF